MKATDAYYQVTCFFLSWNSPLYHLLEVMCKWHWYYLLQFSPVIFAAVDGIVIFCLMLVPLVMVVIPKVLGFFHNQFQCQQILLFVWFL